METSPDQKKLADEFIDEIQGKTKSLILKSLDFTLEKANIPIEEVPIKTLMCVVANIAALELFNMGAVLAKLVLTGTSEEDVILIHQQFTSMLEACKHSLDTLVLQILENPQEVPNVNKVRNIKSNTKRTTE